MKPAPMIVAGTVMGLAGLLSFNSTAVKLSLSALPAATAPPATTTTAVPSAARSATGAAANYSYGILSVKVSVSGTNITNISIASIDDGGNPRSAYIDQASLPLLEQQALSAQSANIQGVSGASYTTAGFEQSLQSALSKLGL